MELTDLKVKFAGQESCAGELVIANKKVADQELEIKSLNEKLSTAQIAASKSAEGKQGCDGNAVTLDHLLAEERLKNAKLCTQNEACKADLLRERGGAKPNKCETGTC